MRKKIIISLLLTPLSLFIFPITTYAVCPVCTVAVIGGLGLSRYLGVDDTVSGIWIGGVLLSSSFWLTSWLDKKYKIKTKFKYIDMLVITITYATVLIPLAWTDTIGHPNNKLLGIDKLVLGTAIGTIAFLTGLALDKIERKIKGKHLFNFQKVVFPVSLLIISSIILYFITK